MARSASRRALVFVAAAALTATFASACGSGNKSSNGPASSTGAGTQTSVAAASLDGLITQSKTENALVIYGNAPAELLKPVLDGFTSQYPWIKVQDQELSDQEIFSKVGAEQGQGAPSADLMISTFPEGFAEANKAGLLKTDYTPLGLGNFPSYARQGPGMYIMELNPLLTGFVTKGLSPSLYPHSFADLAKLARAGKPLTTYSIAHPIGYAATWAFVQAKGAAAWTTIGELGPATKTIDDGTTQLEDALKGQFAAGYYSSGLGRAYLKAFNGQFQLNYTTDFEPLIPRGMAIPNKARHSASAQLFMDFVYSKAGQDALCNAGFTAFMNNFQSSTGCVNSLADLQAHVPAQNIFVVPFTEKLITDHASITARWNTLHFK